MQIGLFHSIQWPVGTDQTERSAQALAPACHADALGFDSVARFAAIRELGIERVMLFLHRGGLPHEKIMSSLELCACEVLLAVREM